MDHQTVTADPIRTVIRMDLIHTAAIPIATAVVPHPQRIVIPMMNPKTQR